MANRSTKEHLGGSHGINISEGIRIERAAEDIFDFWRDLPNLPRFMSYVDRIDLRGDGISHWVIKGPAGVTLEWDARLINEQRPRLIAWESIGDPDVVSAGSVKFTALGSETTDVEVRLQYDPPAGKLGAGLAALTGHSPSSVLRDDLRRLKQLLESDGWRLHVGSEETASGRAWRGGA
jgi:uncharacterized membrane protein